MAQPTRRQYLRAPIKGPVFFVAGDQVQRGFLQSISEGGMLISDLIELPGNDGMYLFAVPKYVDFSTVDNVEDFAYRMKGRPELTVLKIKADLARHFRGVSEIDGNRMVLKAGFRFLEVGDSDRLVLSDYVSLFANNIVYILNLFEEQTRNRNAIKHAKMLAGCLGYQAFLDAKLLRQKLLHDFQSLESL